MTDAEKKMKKYVNAVERRLNLPRKIKARVMSDFSSSIQARRESGLTDEEIYEELGTPKQAAAALNEQMKEYTYRKSPWRFAFLACALYGGVKLLGGLWVNLVYWFCVLVMEVRSQFVPNEAYSVGVIGGADGPTAIFLTTPVWTHYLIPVLALAVGIWGFLYFSRRKQK